MCARVNANGEPPAALAVKLEAEPLMVNKLPFPAKLPPVNVKSPLFKLSVVIPLAVNWPVPLREIVVPPDAALNEYVPGVSALSCVRLSLELKVRGTLGVNVVLSRVPCAKAGATTKRRRTKEVRQVEKADR